MKTLNKTAARIFLSLTEGLRPGEARKINNAEGAFMAVSVDFIREEGGARFYAVAHRYEQNGDYLISDPDVEFYATDLGIAPVAIDQSFGYRRHVEFEGGRPVRWSPRGQADLAAFCNVWMKNIKAQQGDLSTVKEAA